MPLRNGEKMDYVADIGCSAARPSHVYFSLASQTLSVPQHPAIVFSIVAIGAAERKGSGLRDCVYLVEI